MGTVTNGGLNVVFMINRKMQKINLTNYAKRRNKTMKYQMYKILTDCNSDGSVSYSREDMEIIADEHQFEQNFIKEYLGESYDTLLNEIRKRITGIADFAYNDENEAAVRIL
jgi:hypothetical protein